MGSTSTQSVHVLGGVRSRVRQAIEDAKSALRRPSYSSKVFCIGYNKTGTTTVGESFKMLGYRNATFNRRLWRTYCRDGDVEKVIKFATKYDSFDDLPWLKEELIPILDDTFPGSKFVYLERDEQSWQRSYARWTYKVTGKYPDVEKGLAQFRKHREFVLEYFADRPSDHYLSVAVDDPEGFAKLARFLGKTTSRTSFPHCNKT